MTKTMKKYFILISAALLSLACTKEIVDEQEVYDGEYKTITFESVMTKTTLAESGEVAWEAGDQISVYYVADGVAKEVLATASAAGTTSTFTTQIPVEDNPTEYYAAYPAGSGVMEVTETATNFYVDVQGNKCDGSFKSANFSAAHTLSSAMSFQFHNAVGMIRIALPQDGIFTADGVTYAVKGIYVRGQEKAFDDKNCTGPVLFNPTDGTFGDATTVTVNDVEYKAAANINIQNKTFTSEVIASGYAYVPTLPGTWPTGLCVCYYADYGEKKGSALPAVLSKPNSIAIERDEILKLDDLTSKVQFNYYVSPDGEGDGLTSQTPMSLTKMQEMIAATASYQYNVFILRGATINLADGTYNIANTLTIPTPKVAYTLNIKGNNGKAILDGGNTVTDGGTDVLLSDNAKNGKRIMTVSTDTKVLLKGITFQNGYADNGGAVLVSYGSGSTDSDSILDFEDCQFIKNVVSGTGGAIMVSQNSKGGQVRFNNCYFGQNEALSTSSGGGAVGTNGAAAVMFNKCTFFKNKSGRDAFDILTAKSTLPRVGINNCTFNAWNNYLGYDSSKGDYKTKTSRSNGSVITSRGYTVVANTTIWNSQCLGNWGSIALGCVPDCGLNGSSVINCFIRNKDSKNAYGALYLHGSYYQNISYCLYSGAVTAGSAVMDTHYTLKNSFDFGIGGSNVTSAKHNNKQYINGVPHEYYTWAWSNDYMAGFSCPSLDEVRSTIESTGGIGKIFLEWLDTIEGALDTDIMGNSRAKDASCPGSYQQTDTPASK